MRQVTVSKVDLLKTLKKNRKKHVKDVAKAKENHKAKVISVLRQRLKNVEEEGQINLVFNLPAPVDYVEYFDQAIAMAEWEQADDVVLDEEDFKRYVLNEWEWKNQFVASTARYL